MTHRKAPTFGDVLTRTTLYDSAIVIIRKRKARCDCDPFRAGIALLSEHEGVAL